MAIYGCDISHWQGKNINWKKMWNAGIRFVYLKASQGTGYFDDCFVVNANAAKNIGMKIGAYHFVDQSNGIKQYEWFVSCMEKAKIKFDLAPALDCEYTATIKQTEATIDVIASRLCGYQGFPVPAIYTNVGFGNSIFKSAKMKKYLLWVANWGVTAPALPRVWKGEDWYIWQDNVVNGVPYGLSSGKIDHDVWGKKIPFPEDIEPEPTPESITVKLSLTKSDGSVYSKSDVNLEKQ